MTGEVGVADDDRQSTAADRGSGPPSLAYATRRTDEPTAIGWQAGVAVAWLAVAVWFVWAVFDRTADDDRTAVELYNRLNMSMPWSQLVASPVALLAPGFAVAFGFGIVAAVSLFHWPRPRLAWVAVVPAAAAVWVFGQWATGVWEPAAQAAAIRSGYYSPGGFGFGSSRAGSPVSTATVRFVAETVAAVALAQAGLAYLGTFAGRPLARWLAAHLLPPPLRAAVSGLWPSR